MSGTFGNFNGDTLELIHSKDPLGLEKNEHQDPLGLNINVFDSQMGGYTTKDNSASGETHGTWCNHALLEIWDADQHQQKCCYS